MICKEIVIVMALGNRSLSLESTLSCHSAALNTFPLGCVGKGGHYEWRLQAKGFDQSHSSSFAFHYGSEKCSLMALAFKAWQTARDTVGKCGYL